MPARETIAGSTVVITDNICKLFAASTRVYVLLCCLCFNMAAGAGERAGGVVSGPAWPIAWLDMCRDSQCCNYYYSNQKDNLYKNHELCPMVPLLLCTCKY